MVAGEITVYFFHASKKQFQHIAQSLTPSNLNSTVDRQQLSASYLLELQQFDCCSTTISQGICFLNHGSLGNTLLLPASYFYIIEANDSAIVYRHTYFSGITPPTPLYSLGLTIKLQVDLLRTFYQDKVFLRT